MQVVLEILVLLLCMVTMVYGSRYDMRIPPQFFKGYVASRQGDVLRYHSPHPSVTTSLLVRSLHGTCIEWETEQLPADFKGEYATFLWMFGIDVVEDSHQFDLYVNGSKCFTFANPRDLQSKTWTVHGSNGGELTFVTTMIDKYDDFMGYALLTLPVAELYPGRPLLLKVVGESAGSRSWYMTFESAIEESVEICPEDLVLREEGRSYRTLRFNIVHLGAEAGASLSLGRDIRVSCQLQFGHNSIRVKVPAREKASRYRALIEVEGRPAVQRSFTLSPVRKWTVYLVQHTHTDIGYTRPQSEILPEHLRFIDYALDLCDLTDDYPDDARFRWTCESSWPVHLYLQSRPPAQVERLRRRVEEGRIAVTGMYFNMSEIIDEHMLVAQLQPIKTCREHGIPVTVAMQNDVNGIGWCLVDYFEGIGVRYVIMGEHGHRALIPFDRPTPFWWEAPSGRRVMAFRADHYMTGNFFGIDTGNFELFEEGVMSYLKGLTAKEYEFDRIAVQYSGYSTDNSPPSAKACDLIRTWNERYEWPRLRSATAGEFMRYVEDRHAEALPTHRVAWPDWWSDGFGSAARETAAARAVHAGIIARQGLLAAVRLLGAPIPPDLRRRLAQISEALIFYDEHTFGAAESVTDPAAENTVVQWGEKSSYIWEAVKDVQLLGEQGMGLLQAFIPKSDVPTIVVFNSLNWERSEYLQLYVDHEIIPLRGELRIIDEGGGEIPAQRLKDRPDGSYWGLWAEKVPPLGYAVYRIEVSEGDGEREGAKESNATLENDRYRVTVDRTRGAIASLYDKELGVELVDGAPWLLGEFIYERLSNREQLEQFRLEKATRTTLQNIQLSGVSEGHLWKSITIRGDAPGCADERGVECEIRLFTHAKRIELHYRMRKLAVTDPEAVYISFPFSLPDWKIIFEAQGGTVQPGVDQLPGTASDWNTVQNFAAIRAPAAQILFSSPEIPLVQFGGLNIGNYDYVSHPHKPHLFSWVLNNYWVTNFKASQEGELSWHYILTSTAQVSNDAAARFGWGVRVPLLSRVLPAATTAARAAAKSLLNAECQGVVMIAASLGADGRNIILHFREVDGRGAQLRLDAALRGSAVRGVTEVNALEEYQQDVGPVVNFKPYEVKFIKLELPD